MLSKDTVYSLLGHGTPFDKKHTFVSSWILPPVAHSCLRILLGLYCFIAIFYSYVWFTGNIDIYHLHDITEPTYTTVIGSSAIGRSFSYFTYLSYYGQGFYFIVTGVHGFFYARTGTTRLHTRFPPFLQVLHSLFYSCVTCFPILVTLTFWCTMYVGPWWTVTFDAWANVSVHLMNSVMALLEITLATTAPLPWTHLPVLMVILSLYLSLAYLTRATAGFWVYEWLAPNFGWWKIVLHVLGYSVGIVLIFVFVRYAIWTRNWLLKRYRGEEVDLDAALVAEKLVRESGSSRSSLTLSEDPEAQLLSEEDPEAELSEESSPWLPPLPAYPSLPRIGARI